MLCAACCLQVTALSTLGFTFPWAGGRTDVTVTTDTDTGRGPRRGTLPLMTEENPPHTVGLQNRLKLQQVFLSLDMEDLSSLQFHQCTLCSIFMFQMVHALFLSSSFLFPRLSSACPICCSRYTSSEGAVSVGDRGWRRGTHPPRPVHRAG